MGLNVHAMDPSHSGLPCRANSHCDHVWRVGEHATLTVLLAAGRARDMHELTAHGYTHKQVLVPFSTVITRHRFKGK